MFDRTSRPDALGPRLTRTPRRRRRDRVLHPVLERAMPALTGGVARSLAPLGLRRRWVSTEHGPVHAFEVSGTGEDGTLVLLHGLASGGLPYLSLIARLRGRFSRIVVPEAPGHGSSPAPPASVLAEGRLLPHLTRQMLTVLDELLGGAPALVFGNSLGGALAVRTAVQRPDLVRGLFLASPAGAALDDATLARLLDRFRLDNAAEVRRFVDDVYHRSPWYRPLMGSELRRRFHSDVIRTLLEGVHPGDQITPGELGGLRVPIALLWGRSDALMPREHLEWYLEHLPDHAVVDQPDGVGHAPYMDDPALVAERVLGLAERVRAGEAAATTPPGRMGAAAGARRARG